MHPIWPMLGGKAMGEIRTVTPPAKLIFGILANSEPNRVECLQRLTKEFGALDHQSRVEPFTFTDYYFDEMGEILYRQYISSERLIELDDLPQIKHRTNQIEVEMMQAIEGGKQRRQVNIDPGYLTQAKLVLATTKDYNHRVYVSDGIFAEVTLHFRRPEGFQPFPWTYPDYTRPEVCQFFNKVRDTYRQQIRTGDPSGTR
jgi:hypothetical protein